MVVRRIGVFSVAKIGAILYAAIGLLIGLCFAAVFSILPMAARPDQGMPGWLGSMFGVGAIVFMPIMYGIGGFVGGAISATLYNLFAGMVGGVEVEFEPQPVIRTAP